jgi:hypothetical protein
MNRSTRYGALLPARRTAGAGAVIVAALLFASCGAGGTQVAGVQVNPQTAPAQGAQGGYTPPAPASYAAPSNGYGGYYQPQAGGQQAVRGNTPEGSTFANWVLSTDPQHKYIVDAFVRDDQVLGVIVNPTMTKGQVQQAMGALLSGMQRTFPNRPLEVITYYVSGDELARTTWDPRTNQANTVWRQ